MFRSPSPWPGSGISWNFRVPSVGLSHAIKRRCGSQEPQRFNVFRARDGRPLPPQGQAPGRDSLLARFTTAWPPYSGAPASERTHPLHGSIKATNSPLDHHGRETQARCKSSACAHNTNADSQMTTTCREPPERRMSLLSPYTTLKLLKWMAALRKILALDQMG